MSDTDLQPFSYRNDPKVPYFPDDKPVIIFDGVCVMCSAFARFILRRDAEGRYRLLPAQTELGQALYRHYGLDPVDYETNVLIEDGRAYFKSAGSLRILAGLGPPWSLTAALTVVPQSLRDSAYETIARNRYRWFGRKDACLVPTEREKARFLP